MQTIIVNIIILIAIGCVVYYMYQKLRTMKKNRCDSCSGCPLKENCSQQDTTKKSKKSGCEKGNKLK